MMKTLLAIHVAGGSAALLSMFLPLVSRKGGLTHRRAGWVFVTGMTIVSVTALVLSAVRFFTDPSPNGRMAATFLGYIAILTGAGVSAGMRVLRARRRTAAHRNAWDLGVATLLTSAGILIAAYGIAIGQALLIAFAIVGMISGAGQLAYWLRPPSHPMHWWFEHMGQMLGSCIAAITAFLVNNGSRVGLPNTSVLVWLAPTIVGVPIIVIWIGYYARRFARPPRAQARENSPVSASVTAAGVAAIALLPLTEPD